MVQARSRGAPSADSSVEVAGGDAAGFRRAGEEVDAAVLDRLDVGEVRLAVQRAGRPVLGGADQRDVARHLDGDALPQGVTATDVARYEAGQRGFQLLGGRGRDAVAGGAPVVVHRGLGQFHRRVLGQAAGGVVLAVVGVQGLIALDRYDAHLAPVTDGPFGGQGLPGGADRLRLLPTAVRPRVVPVRQPDRVVCSGRVGERAAVQYVRSVRSGEQLGERGGASRCLVRRRRLTGVLGEHESFRAPGETGAVRGEAGRVSRRCVSGHVTSLWCVFRGGYGRRGAGLDRRRPGTCPETTDRVSLALRGPPGREA
jgi:hypothetical protein